MSSRGCHEKAAVPIERDTGLAKKAVRQREGFSEWAVWLGRI